MARKSNYSFEKRQKELAKKKKKEEKRLRKQGNLEGEESGVEENGGELTPDIIEDASAPQKTEENIIPE